MYTQSVKDEGKIDTQNFLFLIGILAILVMGGVILVFWKQLPPQIPWFYSLPWGEEELISKTYFAITLGGLGLIFVLTKMISSWAGKKDEIVKTTVMIGGLMMILLYAASFIRVLSIFLI